MKTLKLISIVIISLFVFTSCDEEDTIIDINTSFSKQVNLVTAASSDVTVSYEIDFSDNTDLDEYLNRVNGVTINAIKYTIISFTGSNTIHGHFTLLSEGETFGPYDHNSILNDAQSQEIFTINDVSKLSVLANKLKNTKKLDVSFKGLVDDFNTQTTVIKVDFDLTVAVQAL